MAIDKIGYRVYNVHRTHPGGLYTYIPGKYTATPYGIPRDMVGIFSPIIWPAV
jgi:hypothetical protein